METVDNRTFKEKVHAAKVKVQTGFQNGVKKVKDTVQDHPMETFTVICLAVPGVLKIVNSAIRAHSQNQETNQKIWGNTPLWLAFVVIWPLCFTVTIISLIGYFKNIKKD